MAQSPTRKRIRSKPEPPPIDLLPPVAPDLLTSTTSVEQAAPKRIRPLDHIELTDITQFPRRNRTLRRYSQKEIEQHAYNIEAHGHDPLVLATRNGEVINGQLHLEAYRHLSRNQIPVIFVDGLTDAEVRAMRVWRDNADHLGLQDMAELKVELEVIIEAEPLMLNTLGMDMARIDLALHHQDHEADVAAGDSGVEDTLVALSEPGFSAADDIWVWESGHRLSCGNARFTETYDRLMAGKKARLVLTDWPYGTKIAGVVSGNHKEFLEGSDITDTAANELFVAFFNALLPYVEDGAWLFNFIDWKSLHALTSATRTAGLIQKSLIVLDKTVANRGGLYKNQAEFIILTKWGDGPSINNVQMGKFGRPASNIWKVAGYAGFRPDRAEALAMHSTVKPLGALLPALLDASNIGDIVLDNCSGSGSLLLACERVGRIAYCNELDPKYVDVAVKRMHRLTGEYPVHEGLGLPYPEVMSLRQAEQDAVRVQAQA